MVTLCLYIKSNIRIVTMNFTENISSHTGKRRFYDIIFFAFISSFIAAVENMFPRPLPYVRIGFSFIIILIILDTFSLKELILLIIIKNVSVALIFAYIFTPPFYLGITGGLASVVVMKVLSRFKRVFSLYGISVVGAMVSNIIQAYISKFLFKLPDISFLIIPISILSLITGSIVGVFALLFTESNYEK